MALETGTYISDLVVANPTHTDGLVQGDGHLRLLKSTILATFPSITGAITATHTIINAICSAFSGGQNFCLVGEPRVWLADTLPSGNYGWLNGQSLNRAANPILFALWGVKYGSIDGASFNVPDWRNVVPVGKGTMGGTSDRGLIANSGPTAGITTLGSLIGEATHALVAAEVGPHAHGYSGTTAGGTTGSENIAHTHTQAGTFAISPGAELCNGAGAIGPLVSGGPGLTFNAQNPTVTISGQTGSESAAHQHAVPGLGFSGSTDTGTGVSGTAHNNIPTAIVCNWITLFG